MTITANTAGFIAAQKRLRTQLGAVVLYHIAVPPTYDISVLLNPDTGRPYDPTAVPVAGGGFADVPKTCLIIMKPAAPLRPAPDNEFTAIGWESGMDTIIDLDSDDYADVMTATEMTHSGTRYKIEEFKPFEIGGTPYRFLVYGMER